MPARRKLLACAALLAAPTVPGSDASSLLDRPHIGRARAVPLVEQALVLLQREENEAALDLLRRAVAADPRLVPAWVNLGAAAYGACRPHEAIVACYIASHLDPDQTAPLENLRNARKLSCPAETESGAQQAEWAAVQGGPWSAAATARRGDNQPLLAAFHLERALESTVDVTERSRLRRALASDLEHAGLWRAALDALEGDDEASAERRRLSEQLATIDSAVHQLAREVAAQLGSDPTDPGPAIQLFAESIIGLEPTADFPRWSALVEETLAHERGRIRTSGLVVELPQGATSTSASDVVGSAALVVKLFPGDAALALFPWRVGDEAISEQELLARRFAASGLHPSALASCTPPREGWSCQRGHLGTAPFTTESGYQARLLRPRGKSTGVLALLRPGDGGCGDRCRATSLARLEALLARLEIVGTDAWERAAELLGDFGWQLPELPQLDRGGPGDENTMPWSSVLVRPGIKVDLPPGALAAPRAAAGQAALIPADAELWWRARYRDQAGTNVAVGNEQFAAWVDAVGEIDPAAWLDPATWVAPSADSEAQRLAVVSLNAALNPLGGGRGAVARFRGRRLGGDWLVLRVIRPEIGGVEIGIPAVGGAQSRSLLWTALTLREEGSEGPPAPVDLSQRLPIRFERLRADTGGDPRGGYLTAGDFRVTVPRQFQVALDPRSRTALPVTLKHQDGTEAKLDRLELGDLVDDAAWRERARSLAGLVDVAPSWTRWERGKQSFALARFEDAAPPRVVLLVRRGNLAMSLRIARGATCSTSNWKVRTQLLIDSLVLTAH